MDYILFLDDERFPGASLEGKQVVVVRTVKAFKETVTQLGFPSEFHLDHDLGEQGGGDGSDCMKWLLDYIIDYTRFCCPPDISFYIHSQNPIGRKVMQGYINDIYKFLGS